MNIVWHYLDKRAATIDVIKDYNSMKHIIDNTDDDIAILHDGMMSPSAPVNDGMPSVHNPKANESRIVFSIDKIDVLKERLRQAIEYMNWFQPAWDELTEDEQFVLYEFYMVEDQSRTDAVHTICDYFKIERSSAYNKKNRALERLTLLLYGK
ncbi:hypothetical protein GWC02_15505 [Listeria monocytogenes]|nr:hypothetical protein [Listeria monocytogenes]EDN8996286.1 hypothetical protein [Listeria monocytogenes]